MRRFVEAWEAVDIKELTALLTGEALMTMPHEQVRIAGRAAIGGFFETVPLDGRLDLIRRSGALPVFDLPLKLA
jgi:hypothetical protein